MNQFDLIDGVLHAEGVALADVADAVGTPTYVYSTATIQRHARVFRDALSGLHDPLICFAVKANPNAAVLATLAAEGYGADVVSGGELLRALAAGVPAGRIVFSGVGKTADEMTLGLQHDIGQFNLESAAEAETLSAVAAEGGQRARVAFRINPAVDAGTHGKISTGRADDKFGVAYNRALDVYARAARLPGLAIQGVAVHIGSQLTDLAPSRAAFERVGALIADLRAAGHDIRTADLGGGLGVPYDPAKPVPPSPDAYGAMVRDVTAGWNVRLLFEPGRVIVGNAGVLLARVVRVKEGVDHPFVVVDAGMNDLLRPSLYDAWHHLRAVAPTGERMTAHIVGPICETGDTFARDREMDRVAAGDLVAFMTAGAYGATMASSYNSRGLTPEVMVRGHQWAIVRERQPIQALIDADRLPPWLANGGTR
jgi:diaminopimelate decarboxylase